MVDGALGTLDLTLSTRDIMGFAHVADFAYARMFSEDRRFKKKNRIHIMGENENIFRYLNTRSKLR